MTDFYSTGTIKAITPYLNNVIEGTKREFYSNGTLKATTQFVNNKK